MAQTYQLVFWRMDPAVPPPAGQTLVPETITVTDANDDGVLRWQSGDLVAGRTITAIWPGDTVTVATPQGPVTITGTTFYLDGAPGAVFIPTDGQPLTTATFTGSTWVTVSVPDYAIPAGGGGSVPCFVAGTLIATPDGARRAEDLRPGDMVLTLDHGPQAIRWVGARDVPGQGSFAPIRFAPGALGNGRELLVSPQHRMLVTGWRAELLFGAPEVLVAAVHLANGRSITRAPRARVRYVHLLFDRHELVWSEGALSESFHPGGRMLAGDAALRAEVLALFPGLAGAANSPVARPVLRRHEAALLRA